MNNTFNLEQKYPDDTAAVQSALSEYTFQQKMPNQSAKPETGHETVGDLVQIAERNICVDESDNRAVWRLLSSQPTESSRQHAELVTGRFIMRSDSAQNNNQPFQRQNTLTLNQPSTGNLQNDSAGEDDDRPFYQTLNGDGSTFYDKTEHNDVITIVEQQTDGLATTGNKTKDQ